MHSHSDTHDSHDHGGHNHHGHGGHGGHGHHHHVHFVGEKMTLTMGLAVVATLALVGVEIVSGYFGHSIALISDGVHNLTDVPSLVISWLGMRWALRPPTHEKTYGYHRAGILAAFVNAIILSLASIFVVYESVRRFREPVDVHSALMMWVALVALVVNGGITFALHAGREDLNVRAVWIHNLSDAMSNVAIFFAALLIRYAHVSWADPVIGVGIGAMVLWSGTGILRESGNVLLEGLPSSMKLEDVAKSLLRLDGVREVHDIHIWQLGTDLNALSCHIRIPDMHLDGCEKILSDIREMLAREFNITHTTIQFERAGLAGDEHLYMPEPARQATK
jgi:cobalt-zinc-cadmium efflux system protein